MNGGWCWGLLSRTRGTYCVCVCVGRGIARGCIGDEVRRVKFWDQVQSGEGSRIV